MTRPLMVKANPKKYSDSEFWQPVFKPMPPVGLPIELHALTTL